MNIRNWWTYIKGYAKRHTFHMVVIVALVLSGIMHVSQYTISGSVYGLTVLNKSNLNKYVKQDSKNRKEDKKDSHIALYEQKQKIIGEIEKSKMELNARIDILDSAIKPEKKRRMLIAKIRDAIKENTKTKLTIRELNNFADAIVRYSYKYDLSIPKVLAQIKQESNFKINAKSPAGAEGPMQIIPETWEYIRLKEFGGQTIEKYNIHHNIRAGCFYMSEQLHNFDNNYDHSLMAYNWGPHKVRRLLIGEYTEQNIPKETKEYVIKINKLIIVFSKYGIEK